MAFDPVLHHRQSFRWKGFDYSSRGLYFITACTSGRELLFGEVANGRCQLSPAGQAVRAAWYGLQERFAEVQFDAFVVMPNHMHAILVNVGTGLPAGGRFIQGAASSAPTVGRIMRAFKSVSAIEVNRLLGRNGQPVWQRNYYERVVRNHSEAEAIRRYIGENPARWELDPENPNAKSVETRMPWE